jgi:hypothetical protein
MTIRQRYKKLSHARRLMVRLNLLRLQMLMEIPEKDRAELPSLIEKAMSLVINPPIVMDPQLTRNFENPLNLKSGWEG